MSALFRNRLAYLGASFALFIVALPLVSIGSTRGPAFLLWAGLAALAVAALIPPVQRLLFAPPPKPAAAAADDEPAH